MTATAAELHDAVIGALRGSGREEQMKAEIRKDIMNMLTGEGGTGNSESREDFLVNELIREYLLFNGYTNSLSVFVRETGQPVEPMNREFLAQAVAVAPHRLIPMLYSLTCMKGDERTVSVPETIGGVRPGNATVTNEDDGDEDEDEDGFFEIQSHA